MSHASPRPVRFSWGFKPVPRTSHARVGAAVHAGDTEPRSEVGLASLRLSGTTCGSRFAGISSWKEGTSGTLHQGCGLVPVVSLQPKRGARHVEKLHLGLFFLGGYPLQVARSGMVRCATTRFLHDFRNKTSAKISYGIHDGPFPVSLEKQVLLTMAHFLLPWSKVPRLKVRGRRHGLRSLTTCDR